MSIMANISIDFDPSKNEIYLLGDIKALQKHRFAWRYARDYLNPTIEAERIVIPVGDNEPYVVMSNISSDINTIASRYDGKKTMHYCLVFFIFSGLTLGIVPLVWSHRISKRIGAELARRGINYKFGAGTFWGWNVLGELIIVGPFIYCHKLLTAMNLLCNDYNVRG